VLISSVVDPDPDLLVFGPSGSGSVIICTDPDPSYSAQYTPGLFYLGSHSQPSFSRPQILQVFLFLSGYSVSDTPGFPFSLWILSLRYSRPSFFSLDTQPQILQVFLFLSGYSASDTPGFPFFMRAPASDN
jgi:hypothetical protein